MEVFCIRELVINAMIFLFFGMFFLGSAAPVSKFVGEGLPVFTASFFRGILAFLFLTPFVVKSFKDKIGKMKKKDWGLVFIISFFGVVGFTVFLIAGMRHLSGVAGSVVISLTPALTAVGARVFLKAPFGIKRAGALMLGIAGAAIVNMFRKKITGDENFNFGILLIFLAACSDAVYTLVGKKATKGHSPTFICFMALALSLPMFFLLALLDYDVLAWSKVPNSTWLGLLWLGAGASGAGAALWYLGLSKTDEVSASGFMAVMPIGAFTVSYLILGEEFYPIHLAGILMALSSVVIMSRTRGREVKKRL